MRLRWRRRRRGRLVLWGGYRRDYHPGSAQDRYRQLAYRVARCRCVMMTFGEALLSVRAAARAGMSVTEAAQRAHTLASGDLGRG